jgi:hypothetical protein
MPTHASQKHLDIWFTVGIFGAKHNLFDRGVSPTVRHIQYDVGDLYTISNTIIDRLRTRPPQPIARLKLDLAAATVASLLCR